jgi:DNA polymerase III delta prime subunit
MNSVDITNDGLKSLVYLAFGDMRKALNIMQVILIETNF